MKNEDDLKYQIFFNEKDENEDDFSEIRKVIDKSSHHFEKVFNEMHDISSKHFFNSIFKGSKPSTRYILDVSNTTYYIQGYNYTIAYRMLLMKNKPLIVCDLIMEHSTAKGKVYQSSKHDVFLSHYFDRLLMRDSSIKTKTRREAINKTLKDLINCQIVLAFNNNESNKFSSIKEYYNSSIQKDTSNLMIEDIFFTTHGIGLCEADVSNDLIVTKTYINKDMLFENQNEIYQKYLENSNKIKATHFFEYNQLKKVVKNLHEKANRK